MTDAVSGDGSSEVGQKTGHGKKETEKKISPLSTLESSFEALNVKKFDAAFAVDPIYHQTSAQFDEGGVMDLLLNNLGLYGGCRVLFDSKEVPGKCVSFENQCGRDQLIDLSFAKGMEDNPNAEEGPQVTAKKPNTKKQVEPGIVFTKALDEELLDVFAHPKNPKSLLLPANRAPSITKLPEDFHYQPKDLVKLFLLPNVMFIRKRGRSSREEPGQQSDDYEAHPSWDGGGGEFGVAKIEDKYDKRSKQVDVQRLKETLWHHIQESSQSSLQIAILTLLLYALTLEEPIHEI
ncbi:unnamed protein product [Linum tenue]|uniref:Condensin complex subunit 2 n=1 Tax=Linum tenue TaxID=586396 RepID=A0AAV0R3C3_9ROSI|nr:unnamed protein product [Linum tenue]